MVRGFTGESFRVSIECKRIVGNESNVLWIPLWSKCLVLELCCQPLFSFGS